MRPYNVEIFTQDFEMVGNTNVNEITYKEDYLSSDGNTVTVLALPGVKKQDYIRISRGDEEYAGIVTEIGYGTDKSKNCRWKNRSVVKSHIWYLSATTSSLTPRSVML